MLSSSLPWETWIHGVVFKFPVRVSKTTPKACSWENFSNNNTEGRFRKHVMILSRKYKLISTNELHYRIEDNFPYVMVMLVCQSEHRFTRKEYSKFSVQKLIRPFPLLVKNYRCSFHKNKRLSPLPVRIIIEMWPDNRDVNDKKRYYAILAIKARFYPIKWICLIMKRFIEIVRFFWKNWINLGVSSPSCFY